MEEKELECSFCSNKVSQDSDFCPECGTLFLENVKCTNHQDAEANGVCVICCEPYCKECGFYVGDRIFLCNEHSEYEIFEGMARIYGASDVPQLEYFKSCLEQSGFHPLLFSRKANANHLGSADYTLYEATGSYLGHIINEIKLMVPLQETIEAEKLLEQINNQS